MSELQLSLTPERPDQGWTPLHGAEAVASAGLEAAEVCDATVGEFVVLEMAPDVFGQIELGRVGWQLFDLYDAVQGFQVVADERQAMCRQPIPNDQQRLSDLQPEGVQELDDLRALDSAREHPEVEAPEGDAGNDGQLMPVEVVLQDGCLALGSPGAHPGRSFAQSRLIDEDDDPTLFRSVFLERASAPASSA